MSGLIWMGKDHEEGEKLEAIMKVVNTGSKQGNCYVLCAGEKILLLDCGCNKKSIQKTIDYNISNIVGCLLSHEHGDHSKSYKWLLENRIPIYTNDETAEKMETTTGELVNGIPEKTWTQIENFFVYPFYVPHDDCPCYGFLIQNKEIGRLLFLTDLEYCPYNFNKLRINHLLVENNYMEEFVNRNSANYSHQIRGHASSKTCQGIIKANKTPELRSVTLIHMSDKVCDFEKSLKEAKYICGETVKVNLAKPGLCVELNKMPF